MGEVIESAGNMHLIIPGEKVKGSFVTDSDSSGCVLSETAAENLFGSVNVIGKNVRICEKDYTIRGILDHEKNLCMIQGDAAKSFSCIRINAPGIPVSVIQQSLSGLFENCVWISDGNFFYGIGSMLFWFPAWIILISGLYHCRKLILRLHKRRFRTALNFMLAIVGFSLAYLLFSASFHFSRDYIPTVWSDFEFWSELIRQKKEMVLLLMESPLQTPDKVILWNLSGTAIFTILSILCIMLISFRSSRG